MLEFFDLFREMTRTGVILRLTLAVFCGGLIGLEREMKHRAAGFRTHILICMGAAITTLTSQYLYLVCGYFTDIARLGAQVIAGIGFIGAGTIIVTRQSRIKGLTTAAGLWVSALIGLCCGAGFVECTIITTFIVLFAELVLIKLEDIISDNLKERSYFIEYRDPFDMSEILDYLRANRLKLRNIEITRSEDGDHYCAMLSLRPANKATGKNASMILSSCDKILSAEQL